MTPVAKEMVEMASFLSGTFHHVDVDRIEKELLDLWQQAGKGSDTDEPSVTRACSITFILFTSDPDAEIAAGDLLEDVTLKHPCRAILAMALPAKEEQLEAWVTARCRMIPGKKDKQICCEQITVRWQGEGTRHLASVVSPLQLVDLPTWLWWQEAEANKENLGPFLPFVERLIVDSSYLDNNLPRLFDLREVFNRLKEGSAMFDLNWRRLLPWRQAIARSFEESLGILSLEELDLISSVTIGVAQPAESASKGYSAQSLLLVSWLASRLSWKVLSVKKNAENEVDIVLKWSRKKIDVALRAVPLDNVTPGTVCFFAADFVGKTKSLVVMQKEGCPGLEVDLVEKSEVQETLCMTEIPAPQLVVDILDSPITGEVYAELLELLCELAGNLK
ncbi:glucose-6-phosphate dehydrogenase assembly protein OpcA [Candidatus Obscuribacterales bacterium]|nr:glucose-6-phosphate dehydrogenase assembly protein OpcA [Candidatus Obscuribacterales bacterium]